MNFSSDIAPVRPFDSTVSAEHRGCMARAIEIEDVPEELRRRFEAKAAAAGLSLSEYLLRELGRMAHDPSDEDPELATVEIIREEG